MAAAAARAQCSKDTDCKGDRLCEEGVCVAPPSASSRSAAPAAAAETAPTEPVASAAPSDATSSRAEEPAQDAPARRKRHSTGMMTVGIVMVAVAPVALLVAALARSQKTSCEAGGYDYNSTGGLTRYDEDSDCGRYDARLYGGAIGGVALLGVGIPLVVIGGRREPAVAHVSPWATPRAAGLRFQLTL